MKPLVAAVLGAARAGSGERRRGGSRGDGGQVGAAADADGGGKE